MYGAVYRIMTNILIDDFNNGENADCQTSVCIVYVNIIRGA